MNVREFAEYKELYPQSSRPRAVEIFRIKAKVFRHRVVIKVVHQLRKDPAKANGGKDRQTQIPQGHRRPPVPRGSVLEISSTSDNEHPIQDHSDDWNHGMRYHPISERYRFIIQLQAIVFVSKKGEARGSMSKSISWDLAADRKRHDNNNIRFTTSLPYLV